MSFGGHLKRRRGWLDHLQEGRVTLLESGAHDMIGLLADKATGIWFGSARAFAAKCGSGDISERQARHLLESLEEKGYIKRFSKRRARGNYPILVSKYEVTFGAYTGQRLNADATMDWRFPVYEPCLVQGAVDGAVRAPSQEVDLRSRSKNQQPCAGKTGLHGHGDIPTSTGNPNSKAVARVWAYYLEKLSKNPKLLTFTPLRQKKGMARLNEALEKTKGDLARAEELMRIAIDALAASPFHLGQNDRGARYDSWEKNLFKSAEQFESWLERG